MEIANRHGIPVIEDAAQAHGAEVAGKRAGTFGAIGCFSFYPGKNLGACGEGGAIVTDDDNYAALVRQLRDWGQTAKYNHERHGFNYRMDGIQGAVLDVKLRYLPEWTERRRANAALLRRASGGQRRRLALEAGRARACLPRVCDQDDEPRSHGGGAQGRQA